MALADLSIASGEWVRLDGPSGSGKTTLIETLAGLTAPDTANRRDRLSWTGAFRAAGVELRSDRRPRDRLAAYRRQVAWLPQRPDLEPGPAGATLDALTHFRGSGLSDLAAVRDRGRELAAELDLPTGIFDQDAAAVSGGEVTRIALVRLALLGRPVVLLDEPGASLDGPRSERAVAMLRRHLPGSAVLVASHDPVWSAAADRSVQVGP